MLYEPVIGPEKVNELPLIWKVRLFVKAVVVFGPMSNAPEPPKVKLLPTVNVPAEETTTGTPETLSSQPVPVSVKLPLPSAAGFSIERPPALAMTIPPVRVFAFVRRV